MTVKNQDGKEVFSKRKEYFVYDFYFAENKEGYLGLNNWDITAMKRIKRGIAPLETDSEVYVIPLTEDTKSVEVEAAFSSLYEPGKSAVINKVTKKIDFKK
ncbi:MAG: hypothetical protein Q8N09_03980 [Thermodesulfovibrionia bacterium]|nr:hypothetical protein [Thermodesulfovibrionia bacterium]